MSVLKVYFVVNSGSSFPILVSFEALDGPSRVLCFCYAVYLSDLCIAYVVLKPNLVSLLLVPLWDGELQWTDPLPTPYPP